MKRYYSSDWHLGHVNMTRAGKDLCGRPFDTPDEMNEAIVTYANEATKPEDELYILGDIAMGKLDESLPWLTRVHCRLILLPGNHDRFSFAYQRKGDRSAKVAREAERYGQYGDVWLETEGKPSEFIAPFISPSGWPVKMSHYPYVGDSHGEDRHSDMRPRQEGSALIHGHVHEEWQTRDNMFNVGVDVNNFKPVSEEELIAWLETM
jgi:calcineurin-like phosphoesterase family protein